jgi:Tol biopolymer transport system component
LIGKTLGPYEITAPLGAGGMGEVFRATDTRLGREVAVKVLPQHLSTNADVRARFEREAKTISSLNHPHICALYDVGREGDIDYLVMELVDGETLAGRLGKGALPADEVLRIGAQIADALDRAHRAGVIHRDLKPGNVMLTKSGAKLLDFGLARATGLDDPGAQGGVTEASLAQSPTVAHPLTAEGSIVGTFHYMAPEQLEGSEADARSDLWAMGCVLYEMATGRRAFDGKSQASLISSVMGSQPAPISQVAPMSPPGLDRAVKQCLAKDPDDRWQTAGDLRRELTWLAEGGSQAGVPAPVATRRKSRKRLAWTLAAAGWLVAIGLTWQVLGTRSPAPELIQAIVDAPPDVSLSARHAETALSPDGRTIAFCTVGGLWIRPLDADTASLLPGTRGAFRPFWSPDSRTIAYFSNEKLMRVPAAGGSPTSICDAFTGRGGTWGPDDTIVFAPTLGGPLMRVAASGGDPVAVTAIDSTRSESGHRFPYFLPDGKHFLFASLPAGPDGWDTYVGSLGSTEVKHLLTAGSVAIYAEPGYLVFTRDGRVLAQRFDASRLELLGAPVSITDAPRPSDLDAEPVASASVNGRLAILRSNRTDTRLEIRDENGVTVSSLGLPRAPWRVSQVAPDERRATVFKGDELWVVDLVRSVPMRVATNMSSLPTTVWSPDGSRIAYGARHEDSEEIYISGLDGRAELVPTTNDPFKGVSDWSRDGGTLVLWSQSMETDVDIWLLPLDGSREPVPYLRSPATEAGAKISPNGRWLAYYSNETGVNEVYVQSFPEPGRKMRISLDGGMFPSWTEGGQELRYFNLARREVISVRVGDGEELEPGTPRKIRDMLDDITSGTRLGEDGERLVSVAVDPRPRDIRIIVNWTALLER